MFTVDSSSGRIWQGLDLDQALGPLLGRCLVVVTVVVLVVARRVLALQALLGDDRRPDSDGRLPLLDVAVELLLPRPVARNPGCLGTLPLDEKGVPIRVIVKPALDIEPLLDGTVHLIVAGIGVTERLRESVLDNIVTRIQATLNYG
jgi:hypothetical protein